MKKAILLIIAISFLFACEKMEVKKKTYLAKVGNTVITKEEFDKEIKNLPDFAQKMFEGGSGREKFLDGLVKKEILYQEALKKGFDKDAEYQKKLNDFRKLTLINILLEKEVESKAKITDQEVEDYYEKHKEEFTDKKTGKAIEFENVKNSLSQFVLTEKQKEVFNSYIEGLKKNYKVEINREALLTPPQETPQQEEKSK